MGALPAVLGLCRVLVSGTLVNTRWANVFHVQKANSQPWADNELFAAATAFRAAYVTRFKPSLVAACIIGNVDFVDLSNDTGGTATAVGSDQGTSTGISSAANVSCGISWKINRRYRGGHPRTYLPGIPSTVISDPSRFTDQYVTAVQTAANGFRGDVAAITVAGTSVSLVCVHYRRDNIPLVTPLISQIQSASVDTRPDSQRRRLGRDR